MKSSRDRLWKESDEHLMAETAQGNRVAFEILYHRYFDRLVWFARGFLFDTQKAEDVVQEVFVFIIQRPEAFDPHRKFSTWLYTVTGNRCKNLLRNEESRQKNRPSYPEESKGFNPWEDPQQEEEKLRLQLELARKELTENEKMLLSLRFEQELSIKEIALIQNKPEGTIKSGLFYMLRKLAAHLKEFAHGNV